MLDYVGYNYRQNREGSIMSSDIKPKNITDVTELMEQRIDFFEKKDEIKLAEMAKAYYFRTTLTNYITAVNVLKNNDLAELLFHKLKDNKTNILKKQIFRNKKN